MASKTEQAFMILKERIMNGTYGPGYRLVIDQLVREHGISSVPWRESLRRLQAEGWVEIVPNVGALVATFDTDAWQQGLQIVARLGGYATALSAPHLTEADLTAAHTLNRQMKEALSAFDPARFGRLNREFHRLLACRCRRSTASSTWSTTSGPGSKSIRRSAFWYAPGRAQAAIAEHEGILELIEAGASAEAIEAAAKQHEINTIEAVTTVRGRPCPTSGF